MTLITYISMLKNVFVTSSVAELQQVICQACHISEDKQVLLISGGESLDPCMQVHKYHAGTVSYSGVTSKDSL